MIVNPTWINTKRRKINDNLQFVNDIFDVLNELKDIQHMFRVHQDIPKLIQVENHLFYYKHCQ